MLKKCFAWTIVILFLLVAGLQKGAGTVASAAAPAVAQSAPRADGSPVIPYWAFTPWLASNENQFALERTWRQYEGHGIPIGVFVLQQPWEPGGSVLAWDADRYPNPDTMQRVFEKQGVRLITEIQGFVQSGSPDYPEVRERGFAVNQAQTFRWLGEDGVHLDFTHPEALQWLHHRMDRIQQQGVSGWWVASSADALETNVVTIRGRLPRKDFKKVYFTDLFDYARRQDPNTAVLALAYAQKQGGIGAPSTKLSFGWNGTFNVDFPGLEVQKDDMYEAALRGYTAPGIAIGGVVPNRAVRRTLTRALQFAALTPFMYSTAITSHDGALQTWLSDEQTIHAFRYYGTLHNELAPYLFHYGVEANLNGKSILRLVDKAKDHHMLGQEIFVSAILSDTLTKAVEFPSGARWINYWNEAQVYSGGTTISYTAPIERFPIYFRAGAIIPMEVKNAMTGHGNAASRNRLTLQIYPAGQSSITLHRPLGEGVEYTDVRVDVDEALGTVRVTGIQAASYRLRVKSFSPPRAVTGADSWTYNAEDDVITIDKQGRGFEITIKGLEGYGANDPENGLITSLAVFDGEHGEEWSVEQNLQVRQRQYSSGSQTLISIPEELIGSAWIRTANDSKHFTGQVLATFIVTQDVEVYVAHRQEIAPNPAWLSAPNGWTDTNTLITNNEPRSYRLYKKFFPANSQVTLGQNGSTQYGMYTIFVRLARGSLKPAPRPPATSTPTVPPAR